MVEPELTAVTAAWIVEYAGCAHPGTVSGPLWLLTMVAPGGGGGGAAWATSGTLRAPAPRAHAASVLKKSLLRIEGSPSRASDRHERWKPV